MSRPTLTMADVNALRALGTPGVVLLQFSKSSETLAARIMGLDGGKAQFQIFGVVTDAPRNKAPRCKRRGWSKEDAEKVAEGYKRPGVWQARGLCLECGLWHVMRSKA